VQTKKDRLRQCASVCPLHQGPPDVSAFWKRPTTRRVRCRIHTFGMRMDISASCERQKARARAQGRPNLKSVCACQSRVCSCWHRDPADANRQSRDAGELPPGRTLRYDMKRALSRRRRRQAVMTTPSSRSGRCGNRRRGPSSRAHFQMTKLRADKPLLK
jgi:hypothetical protein